MSLGSRGQKATRSRIRIRNTGWQGGEPVLWICIWWDPLLNDLLDPDPGIGKGIIASTGAKTYDFVTVGHTGGSVGKPDDPYNPRILTKVMAGLFLRIRVRIQFRTLTTVGAESLCRVESYAATLV